MIHRMLADLVVILHLLFIIFALLGGSLTAWRRYMLFVHLPAALWVALISFNGWVCPLTPLENQLRQAAGSQGYSGGFIEHYIIPIIYPVGLRVDTQVLLGVAAIGINITIYALVYYWCRLRRERRQE